MLMFTSITLPTAYSSIFNILVPALQLLGQELLQMIIRGFSLVVILERLMCTHMMELLFNLKKKLYIVTGKLLGFQ